MSETYKNSNLFKKESINFCLCKNIMKKVIKIILAVVLALVIIGGVTFLVDCSAVKSSKTPIFARCVKVYDDGGTMVYIGLGYKIIDFNMLNGYDEVKIGTWFINSTDFKDEYEKYKFNIIEDKTNDIIDDKDIIDNKTNESGEKIETSGDKITETGEQFYVSGDKNIVSGEAIETSGDKKEPISNDEKISINNKESGEHMQASGEKNENEKQSFLACIVGIKGNTMIVTPLENEEINKSADMISFSFENIAASAAQNYLIGQKVKITYTGYIMETYPAQILATAIEIIN